MRSSPGQTGLSKVVFLIFFFSSSSLPHAFLLTPAPRDALYKFGYITSPFGFFIQRTDTGEVLFNSSASANNPQFRHLVFENQYLEISTQLPGESNIYGLGERRMPLRLETGLQYTFWSADELTPYLENNYGSHPFYMEHRNGKSHGVVSFCSTKSEGINHKPKKQTKKNKQSYLNNTPLLPPVPAEQQRY